MRTALALLAVLAMLVSARAKPLECVLWPRSAGCQPAPVSAPPPAPKATAPAPKVDPGRPMPRGPVATKAQPKPKAATPRRVKPVAKPSRRKAAVDDGPGLPWPCWTVRIGAAGKSTAELRAEGKRRGFIASRKQCLEAQACLNRNLSC